MKLELSFSVIIDEASLKMILVVITGIARLF